MRTVKFRYKCKGHDKLFYDSDPNFAYITQYNIIACCDGGMRFVEDKQEFIGLSYVVKNEGGGEYRVDVYEGDILLFEYNGEITTAPVEWIEHGFWCTGVEGVKCFFSTEYKVIGNIHENPELLTKKR